MPEATAGLQHFALQKTRFSSLNVELLYSVIRPYKVKLKLIDLLSYFVLVCEENIQMFKIALQGPIKGLLQIWTW